MHELRPGDTLVLTPGRYLNGLPVHGMVGMPRKPALADRTQALMRIYSNFRVASLCATRKPRKRQENPLTAASNSN